MNLYWCHEKHEYNGLWVVAESRGKAKVLYAFETTTDFLDVRCDLHRKDVGNIEEGCLDLLDKRLEMLGVTYDEESEDEE